MPEKNVRLAARKAVLARNAAWMRDYMKSFYNEDQEIQHAMLLKEAHTGRVQAIIRELAIHLGLSEEDVALAELMGLLHDIGRFRQFTVYRTFKDHLSEDHATAGLKLMDEHRLLEGLLPWEQSLIRFAVEWHNKKTIAPASDACHLGYAKMLRDADKLDIYHVLEPFLPSEDGSGVSPNFIEKFVEGVQCDYTMVGTEDDKKLVRLMWVYDIYFAWTLKRIEDRGYIEKLIRCLPKGEKVDLGVARLRAYVQDKLKESDNAGFQSSHESDNTKEMWRMAEKTTAMASNFVENIIDGDLKSGKYVPEEIHTRFPPEPNGYLHIGHAKSICLNFGLARRFGGKCNLRFDDTNPTKEDTEYVDSIQEDVKWLGFSWEDRRYYASDYFEKLYEYAVELIKRGRAFVCDLSADEIRAYRGTLTEPGKESPYRNRSVEENLDLFARMKAGEFPDGSHVLRAKIDMASPNITMRDPVLYRIAHISHHRTGDEWNIYPMYDFAHPLSDAIEGITHSVCTLEFEDHRPLYDWLLEALGFEAKRPHQYEFARLNLTNTVMSKRKLRQLVEGGYVSGWDDPRMPTISGLRRRGYTAAAIRDFCERIGVAKSNSLVDVAMLEHCVREDLNENADRVMAVLEPLKIVITNYPEGQTEYLLAENHPTRGGHRYVPFSREIFIEQEDFMEEPPKKFFRLKPGGEVRLKHAYIIKCEEIVKDEAGNITELHCTYDPDSKSGGATAGRKVKGTLHWVEAKNAVKAEVRLYDYLLTTDENGNVPDDFLAHLNPNSLRVLKDALIEPSVRYVAEGTRYQFLRKGYFCVDKDTMPDHLVFNEVVGLKDTWGKVKG